MATESTERSEIVSSNLQQVGFSSDATKRIEEAVKQAALTVAQAVQRERDASAAVLPQALSCTVKGTASTKGGVGGEVSCTYTF